MAHQDIELKVLWGGYFCDSAKKAAKLSLSTGKTVGFCFNGKRYRVNPKTAAGVLAIFKYSRKILESFVLQNLYATNSL